MKKIDKNKYITIRQCPSCKSKQSRKEIISNINLNEKKQNISNYIKYWDGFFNTKAHFDYYRCEMCMLLFNKEYLKQNILDVLYSNMKENMNEAGISSLKRTQGSYLELFKKITIPCNQSYLEIGPGVGYFAEKIDMKYKFSNKYFIEPNIKNHPKLKKIPNSNINIELKSIDNIPNNSLSLVVLIQVIDHLLEPKKLIDQIEKKLMKNGLILVISHNEKSLFSKIFGKRWPIYCIQHPQLFNKKTIENLMNTKKIEKIKSGNSKNYFSINFLLTTLMQTFGSIRIFKYKILDFQLPLKLGNFYYIGKKIN